MDGSAIECILSDDTKVLDEVVVVGYGTQKKSECDGCGKYGRFGCDRVTPCCQRKSGITRGGSRFESFYQFKWGVTLNTSMNINIRGTGSIGDGSVDSPLILIDGIEGDLNSLNPNDVESVSVLKDAASASIYGSRAAFWCNLGYD